MDPTPPRPRIGNYFRKLGFAFLFLFFPLSAHAASLYISPSAKQVAVGKDFTLSVYVSSPDDAMNAASGDISFPSDKLQVLSISKANSIMTLWIRDPSFTNDMNGGNIHFEGIVLNPGFTGTAGNIITITFQAVATGDAAIAFSSGAVLANDGNGTNILDGMQSGDVTIGPAVVVPIEPPSGTKPNQPENTASTTGKNPIPSSSTVTSTAIGIIPASIIPKWQSILNSVMEWELVALLGLVLFGAIIFLAVGIVYEFKRWRLTSGRNLLILEETLRSDLKRIESELNEEKRDEQDSTRKNMEEISSHIKKDIGDVDDLMRK